MNSVGLEVPTHVDDSRCKRDRQPKAGHGQSPVDAIIPDCFGESTTY